MASPLRKWSTVSASHSLFQVLINKEHALSGSVFSVLSKGEVTDTITIVLEWSTDSFLFFTDYLFNFATAATKKITESVAETAQTIKKSVEEGKIDDIIDKVHLNIF